MGLYKQFNKILNSGFIEDISEFDKGGIKVIRFILMLSMISTIVIILPIILMDKQTNQNLLMMVVSFCICGFILTLSNIGKTNATKILFVVYMNISLFITVLFTDPKLDVEVFFFANFAFYFVIFRRISNVVISSLITISLLITCALLQLNYEIPRFVRFTVEESHPFRILFMILSAFAFLSVSLYFRRSYDKKQEQIVLANTKLQKALTNNKEKNESLKTALEENKLIFNEIHHRVKNNLQLISSLIDIQSDNITDKKAYKALMETKSRVYSIALIHQKLYQEDKIAKVNMRDYFTELIEQINVIHQETVSNVQYKLHIDDIEMELDTAVPLGLITNELLTNAFKHAFKKHSNPVIEFNLETDKDNFKLSFKDNGKGIPEGTLENSKGFGIQLMNMLVSQLHGELESQNTPNGLLTTVKFNLNA